MVAREPREEDVVIVPAGASAVTYVETVYENEPEPQPAYYNNNQPQQNYYAAPAAQPGYDGAGYAPGAYQNNNYEGYAN